MELIRGLQSVEQELRLPLTQPILPADEVQADNRGGDTVARPLPGPNHTSAPRAAAGPAGARRYTDRARRAASQGRRQGGQLRGRRAAVTPLGRYRAGPGGAGTDGRAPAARPPGAAARTRATVKRGTRPSAAEEDPTRRRGPMHVDPNGPAGQPDDDPTRQRGPVRLDPRGPRRRARSARVPAGAREETTMARSARRSTRARTWSHRGGKRTPECPHPGLRSAECCSRRPWRWGTSRSFEATASSPGPDRGRQSTALTAGRARSARAAAPRPVRRRSRRTAPGGNQVRFTWKYANPAAGDTFRWQRVTGSGAPRA